MKKRIILSLFAVIMSSSAYEGDSVYSPPQESGQYILTPPETKTVRINSPSVFGVRPGSPFLFTIPVSGERPVKFSVENLPEGLTVDESNGKISGTIIDPTETTYPVTFHAKNSYGEDVKEFKIKVGRDICLTPPLGWNSWNCWGAKVDQEKVLASAKAMVDKGLCNYGWTYINIDDSWQGERSGKYNAIQPNAKFPDIKKLCDEIHNLGLKIGVYSSPWVTTYTGYVGGSSDNQEGGWDKEQDAGKTFYERGRNFRYGKYTFETNDAAQWAEWGVDFLKYDWQGNDGPNTIAMAKALEGCGRDIVFSLSNSANPALAKIYAQRAHCWRTTGDLKDRWNSDGPNLNLLQAWEMHRAWLNAGTRGGPGHFPDADMLVIGKVVERNSGEALRPSRLTADEQYTHISLWALWSCPLLIGCPIDQLDNFTLGLHTNTEVLDIKKV
ncbi:MAG: putative Ig domain-containing protein [Kiritimatiellales bacterium]